MPADTPAPAHSLRPPLIGGPASRRPDPRPQLPAADPAGDTEQGSTPAVIETKIIPAENPRWMGVETLTLAPGDTSIFTLAPDLDTFTIYCAVNAANDNVFASYGGDRFQLPSLGTEVSFSLTLPANAGRECGFYNRDAAKTTTLTIFMCRNCEPPRLVLGVAG